MINNNNNFSDISSMSASVYYGDGQYLTGVIGTTGSNGTSGTSGMNGTSGSSGLSGEASGRVYYLEYTTNSDIGGYKLASDTPIGLTSTPIIATVSGTSSILVGSFLTAIDQPNVTALPAGTAYRSAHVKVDGSSRSAKLILEIYKRSSGGTETLLRTDESDAFSNTLTAQVDWNTTFPLSASLLTTDRLLFKLYAVRVSGPASFDVTVYFEDDTASFVKTTISVGGVGPAGTSGTSGISGTSGTSQTAAGSFGITVDGGGSVIPTGLRGFVVIPYSGTITEWTIIADQSGSSVVDIWKSTYAGAPPTIANTITGSALPTLTASQKAQSSTLTGWTTSVTTGDVIGFNVNSASTITRLNLSIKITKS